MKFFIDTANLEAIKEAAAIGMADGVTTNPSLVAKEGMTMEQAAKEISKIIDGPISVEVLALDAEGMIKEAEEIAQWGKNIVVKIPSTTEGLKAIAVLNKKGIQTNATLCFSPNQALLVAKAGATYVSPFVGRLDDIGEDGMSMVADILDIYENYEFDTEVIVASIRSTEHVKDAALIGADIATIPPSVIKQLMEHPLTDKGLENFLADWKKGKK
jgi:transaldolase